MAAIRGALEDLCAALRGQGIPAAVNAEDVQVPGAWVTARDLTPLTLAGGLRITVHVWLVVSDADDATALDSLEQLLEGALEVLTVDPATGDAVQLAATLVLPTMGTPLPAFQITTTLDL
jgi:hypothetical protein